MKRTISILAALALLAVGCSEKAPQLSTDTQTSEPGKAEDIVITVAVSDWTDGSPIPEVLYGKKRQLIEDFNAADNGIRVEVVNYSEGITPDHDGTALSAEQKTQVQFRIVQDIINSGSVDVICNASIDPVKYEALAKQGAFADLYPFMAEDPEVNRSTLDEHVISLLERDGKLDRLPVGYYVETFVGETRYVGTKENWTMEDFIAQWERMPADAVINGGSHGEDVYRYTLVPRLVEFVDYDKAEVHFDSPEFRKALEFCKGFASNGGEKLESDGDLNFGTPEILSGYRCAHDLFSDEVPYTMVGYPSDRGQGAYISLSDSWSICTTNPEKQRAAWELIRLFACEDYQSDGYMDVERFGDKTNYGIENYFPINRSVAEAKMNAVIAGELTPLVTDEVTFETYQDHSTDPTREECQRLLEYVRSVDRLELFMGGSLRGIVEDEVMTCLAGESTIDQCIDRIQNRATIWISEQG